MNERKQDKDLIDIKKFNIYYERFCANNFDRLNKRDKFFEKCSVLKQTQEERQAE